ncbi:endolytic transglycosylase MltG [Thermobifida alba]|uniref:Endolytic murein transglycosylase n=1 Tax=Thermobifida alba TaxID=53522 RepID=A0ABY4L1D5_THEAE|nr:endolytic transglycosylase MltG [Thermobifida alba]UPT21284.1 endolytic transglycosylase MltG [Thermobifida alba]
MNGNDRYDDYPRRARRPDPLTDPWPLHREAEAPRTGASAVDYGGRGYRDERGVGRRRRVDTPRADSTAWPSPRAAQTAAPVSGTETDRPAEAERPRGRRRRPGPADTGSFTLPPTEAEALLERPRGRRRKPDSEEWPSTPRPTPDRAASGPGAETVEAWGTAGHGRPTVAPDTSVSRGRRAGPEDGAAHPADRGAPRLRDGLRHQEAWSDDPLRVPREHRPPADAEDGAGRAGSRRRVLDEGDWDAPPRGRRARPPAPDDEDAAPRSRRRAHAAAPPAVDEEPPRRERRTRATTPDEEDPDSFALPFDEDDDEEPPQRSRSGRRGGRRASGRRASSRRKRKKSKAALVSAVLVLTLFVVSVGAGGYLLLRTYVIPPDYSGEGTGEVSIVIEEGDTGTAIAEKLHEAGVIASVRAFTNEIRFSEANFVPGTYQLRMQMSAEAAIALLLDPGSRIALNVTIPEGLRSGQILERLAEQTGIPLEEFQAAYEDHGALGLPEYATQGPEGYLFPETYEFDSNASAAEILRKMVAQYRKVATEVELERRAEEAGFDPNEIMAIAAIVQAESGKVEDMGKIARVVYNRLADGMYLKMDSTCFYALGEYGIAINLEQQDRCRGDETGYDTYFHEGLPVGPIVSPGKDAIEAALAPEEGPWLFFVATDPENGVTKFTDSEAEFWELVEEFNQSQAN